MAAAGFSYRYGGVGVVRATTDPGGLDLPDSLDTATLDAGRTEQATAWIRRLWQRGDVRTAILVASPVLYGRIDHLLSDGAGDREVGRILTSLSAYLLRWKGRATPFGLFAGIAPLDVEARPRIRWGSDHHCRARADASWVAGVVTRLEHHPQLLDMLPVVLNSAAVRRGDRVVITGCSGAQPHQVAAVEVSVRCSGPILHIQHTAARPVRFSELAATLLTEFPALTSRQVRQMLVQLVEQGFLLTSLRAPMTTPNAFAHLLTELDTRAAPLDGELAHLRTQLAGVYHDLTHINTHTDTSGCAASAGLPAHVGSVIDRMTSLVPGVNQPLMVDVALDCELALPNMVLQEAALAARTLVRLSPLPFGFDYWRDFHVRFKGRYGASAVVAVRDLISDAGLGLPAGFLGSAHQRSPLPLTGRDQTLLALVQQAIREQSNEIVLTEPLLRTLTVGDPDQVCPVPRVELGFALHAESIAAIASGRFRLLVTATPRPSSSMIGRFADLLPERYQAWLADSYTADNWIAAQLSFPTRRRNSENIARTPQVLPRVISMAEHRPVDGTIGLDDLAVTADARHLFLIQLSTGQPVQAHVLHALESGTLTPPLARFLAELGTARCAVYRDFDWGTASSLPYLPRIRHGRTILSAARWLLAGTDVAAPKTSDADWNNSLSRWRRHQQVPAEVILNEEGGLQLPLNLDHPLHRALLRTRLNRRGIVELREAPGEKDLAWIGRPHEILVPLVLDRQDSQPHRPPARTRRPAHDHTRSVRPSDCYLPGTSRWLYAQILGHPDRQDEILADHLPRLFADVPDSPVWWYSRHHDPTRPQQDRYLQLYMRLEHSDDYTPVVARLGQWATTLRQTHLIASVRLGTYEPQVALFGSGEATLAAEDVFAADTTTALAQILLARSSATPGTALAAASLVDLACSFATSPSAGLRWLIEQLPQAHGRLDPSLRDTTCRLSEPTTRHSALLTCTKGQPVADAWDHRRQALQAYRHKLAEQTDPQTAVRSLLHQHTVRALGTDADHEGIVNRLARNAALRQLARHELRHPAAAP